MSIPGKRKDDDYNEDDSTQFDNIRKNIILGESRCFSDKELSINKSCNVIVKLLYLLQHGELLTSEEATDLFFAATKLFQSNDLHLRRLTYLLLKDLHSVESENALIVVSCLNKDMTSKIELFRSNSIRVLCKIIDGSMLAQLERFLKQNLIDKNSHIITSVLILAQQLYRVPGGSDVIKRWVTEISEQLKNPHPMVSYHSLSLLLKIKSNDRLAVNKLIVQLAKSTTQQSNNSLQQILYIRVIYSMIKSSNPPPAELIKIIRDSLKSKFQMVQYESARVISELDHVQSVDIIPCITVLNDMLQSSIPTHRFAALRTLNSIVIKFPTLIHPCISTLETLINDTNRSIATMAITVLLKTGNEGNIEKLIKNITNFITEVNDEFKIILIHAIESLCMKFHNKSTILLNFLASALREEGGYKYKKIIVNTILNIVEHIDNTTELALDHFCEFIEDCEYPELCITILHLLGEKGIHTKKPNRYIRFIFNRCILETGSVRAAAVSSLAQFALYCPQLTQNIIILLQRSLLDNDDEVRDRAKFYLHILNNSDDISQQIQLQSNKLPPLHSLEYSLQQYNQSVHNTPFNMNKHYIDIGVEKDEIQDNQQSSNTMNGHETDHSLHALPTTQSTTTNSIQSTGTSLQPYIEQLQSIPELVSCGPIYKSCQPIELTEAEAEYVVQCIKHITDQYIIFQYIVYNNMENTELTNVTIDMECENDEFAEEYKIAETSIKYNNNGVTYVVFTRSNNTYNSGSITCRLNFTTSDIHDGVVVGGSAASDEYQLEDIEIVECDYVKSMGRIGLIEYRSQWESVQLQSNEVEKRYSLSLEPLQDIVNIVIDNIGCTPIEDTNIVADGASSHTLRGTGLFYPDITVCVQAKFLVTDTNTKLQLIVRSGSKQVSQLLASAIR